MVHVMSEVKKYNAYAEGLTVHFELDSEGAWVAASDFDAQRLRADTAEAELKAMGERYQKDLVLSRERWCYGNRADAKLAAAEQRIAELTKAFEKFRDVVRGCERLASKYSPCIDSVDEDGGDNNDDPTHAIFHRLYYAMFDADAALKPNPEAEIHE
jgi:hypothetical protein